jgi:hypothetical protein
MSYLAIGSVSRAIALLLERKLNRPPLLGAITPRVTLLPLDDERVDDADGVNIFLYRIIESPFAKNVKWRGDRSHPRGAQRPPLAVTLNYILTAYAQQVPANGTGREDITAHQLIGNAMAILHEHPVLNDVHDGDFDADEDTQFARELRDSFEKIKITLMPHSMEEFSKIWTGLNKGYRLSVGYEVSLVEIAPIVPAPAAGPAVQILGLEVDTIHGPSIGSITPTFGPAGQEVTIVGSNLKRRGGETSVVVDDFEILESDLTSITSSEIVFNIPTVLHRGPKLRLSVFAAGLESDPVFFEVQPWMRTLQPLRGFTGIPLTIPFDIPEGATIGVEIDGAAAVVATDPANKFVRATVPATITTNGPKPVVLMVDEGTPARTNARLFEVLPRIQSVNVTTVPAPASTTIQVNGDRLNGTDVSIRYGKLLISRGENANPAQVTVDVPRLLATDLPISVLIDGRESNTLPPRLDSIDPPEAFAGDDVTLTGRGLSGTNVIVRFGATNAPVGPQPFASRFSVGVPLALASGPVAVTVSVNGNDTNSLQFTVVS